jgi:uncharacterized membrane protein
MMDTVTRWAFLAWLAFLIGVAAWSRHRARRTPE